MTSGKSITGTQELHKLKNVNGFVFLEAIFDDVVIRSSHIGDKRRILFA